MSGEAQNGGGASGGQENSKPPNNSPTYGQMSSLDPEYRNILKAAWIQTNFERDKTIVSLSSLGLGFVITFLKDSDGFSCLGRILFLAALIGFVVSVIGGVWCLHINRSIIVRKLKGIKEKHFTIPDRMLSIGFFVGILSLCIIGIAKLVNI